MKGVDPLKTESFQQVADSAPVMLWRITADFRCDWVNKAWLDYTGERLENQIGFAWLDRLHPDDVERTSEQFDRAFTAREATQVEFRLRRHDGEYRWFLDSGAPFYRAGSFAGFVGSCVDVTSRKAAEGKLAAVRAWIREILAFTD